jgi:hypothetical protein
MKRSDLGIVMIHWMLVVVLLGAAASGICLWKKELQPQAAIVFPPQNVGVIHISLSVAILAFVLLHLWWLKHKRFLGHLAIQRIVVKGRMRWGRVNILLYWILLATILIETITGILLTKLINHDVLARIFGIEKAPLLSLHLYLVLPVLVFPIAHIAIHWLDGRLKKVLSIFRPHVFPRGMSHNDIVDWLRRENAGLREKIKDAANG